MPDTVNKEVFVDKVNQVIKIKWPSAGILDEDGTIYHHKFTKISIDTAKTFNCKDEPSSKAITKIIDWSHDTDNVNGIGVDRDLYFKNNEVQYFEIPFNDIYLSEDVANDLIFVWIEEQKGTVSSSTFTPVTDENPVNHFAITLHVGTFFDLILSNINIIGNECNNCKNVECSDVNFMLAWQGFDLAKTLGKYKQMVYYWNIMHNVSNQYNNSSCNCH